MLFVVHGCIYLIHFNSPAATQDHKSLSNSSTGALLEMQSKTGKTFIVRGPKYSDRVNGWDYGFIKHSGCFNSLRDCGYRKHPNSKIWNQFMEVPKSPAWLPSNATNHWSRLAHDQTGAKVAFATWECLEPLVGEWFWTTTGDHSDQLICFFLINRRVNVQKIQVS